MNRIREIREKLKLTQAGLAKRANTTQETIHRLEAGKMQLTEDWMRAIAVALDCTPADLITAPTLADFREDAAPYVAQGDDRLKRALSARALEFWSMRSDALENLGINPGDVVLFDHSQAAVDNVKTGDVVIAQLYDRDGGMTAKTVIRQFIAPGLLVTNRRATNVAMTLDHQNFEGHIKGVRVENDSNS